jgi:aminoglycoside phosphotransferase (APT) family kinase protein
MTALIPDLRDHALLVQALLPWLHARLPDADRIELPAPHKPDAGGSSETYFLSPRISSGGLTREPQWVLRIEPSEYQIYQHAAVEPQYRVMQTLRRIGAAPVPRMLWYEADPVVLGAPFFIMEKVAGEIPGAFTHSQGLLPGLEVAARHALWLSAVEAMAQVHAADPLEFAFLGRPGLGPTGLDQEIVAWDEYARWTKAPIRPVQERAREWLGANLPAYRPTGLAWGDARLGNMVFDGGRCVAILDWETVSLGGAETDLGWWIFFDWMMAEGLGVPRLEGIGDGDALLSAWARFAGREARDMVWHELFATWRYSLVSDHARHLARLRDPDGPIASNTRSLAVDRLDMLLAG